MAFTMTISERTGEVSLGEVEIGFRNFEGKEGDYNKAGDRSFVAWLPMDAALELKARGWNVKFPKDQLDKVDPDQPARDPYLSISVGFERFPPSIHLISEGKPPLKLQEEDVIMLDWAELEKVDLVLRPYHWSVRNDSGIKAYLKNGYFTIVSDRFAASYGL